MDSFWSWPHVWHFQMTQEWLAHEILRLKINNTGILFQFVFIIAKGENYFCLLKISVSNCVSWSNQCVWGNDHTIGWQNWNPLSHPIATLALQARASGENFNYMTLAPQARQARPSGEIWTTCWVTILTS